MRERVTSKGMARKERDVTHTAQLELANGQPIMRLRAAQDGGLAVTCRMNLREALAYRQMIDDVVTELVHEVCCDDCAMDSPENEVLN